MKKLKLFEGLAKQKINEYHDDYGGYGDFPFDFAYKYQYLKDKPMKELLEIVVRSELSLWMTEEEQCAYWEIQHRLVEVFGEEYEEKYGFTELDIVLDKKYNNGDCEVRRELLPGLVKEVNRYMSVVNESKMRVNESRNPRKGDIIVIDGDLEVKVLHCFTSAKSAAAYERKVNITKDDGYSISEKINSGVIDANESGLYVYALYEDKIKLFDFTDEDVDWEIKDKK